MLASMMAPASGSMMARSAAAARAVLCAAAPSVAHEPRRHPPETGWSSHIQRRGPATGGHPQGSTGGAEMKIELMLEHAPNAMREGGIFRFEPVLGKGRGLQS